MAQSERGAYHGKVSGPGRRLRLTALLLVLAGASLASCAPSPVANPVYRDPNMDFGAIQTVAVMPFQNLTRDNLAADRVRDVFMNRLLSTGAVYVVPVGEVARGVARTELQTPTAPAPEDAVKLSGVLKANAILTGTVQEYGEVRSGSSAANVVSLTVQMLEGQTGRVVWTASSTKGGIDLADRLFGGGGRPMNDVTRDAVDDVIRKLFE
jgi:hypothetical protein